jgi:hypothetical protein
METVLEKLGTTEGVTIALKREEGGKIRVASMLPFDHVDRRAARCARSARPPRPDRRGDRADECDAIEMFLADSLNKTSATLGGLAPISIILVRAAHRTQPAGLGLVCVT